MEVVGVVGIPLTVAAKIFYQDNMAQACGIHFRSWFWVFNSFEGVDSCWLFCIRVKSLSRTWRQTQFNSTAWSAGSGSASGWSTCYDASWDDVEAVWHLTSLPCKQKRKQAKAEEPSPKCISQLRSSHRNITNWHCARTSRAVNCNVSGKKEANIPKQLPGDKLPTPLGWQNDIRVIKTSKNYDAKALQWTRRKTSILRQELLASFPWKSHEARNWLLAWDLVPSWLVFVALLLINFDWTAQMTRNN